MQISPRFKKYSVLVTNPALAAQKIANSLKYLYMSEVRKDEFYVAHKRWVRDAGDVNLRLRYDLNPQSVVFDLGGYKGDFAAAIHERYGCQVYLFEPVKEFYNECLVRFEDNPNVRCFNYGLSDKQEEIYITDEKDASSLVKVNADDKKNEKVLVKDFAEVFQALQLKQIDLLKINIEGGEFSVLPRIIQNNLIEKVVNIQVQFHNFIPNAHPMREKIRKDLLRTHRETWNYPFVWENWELKKKSAP